MTEGRNWHEKNRLKEKLKDVESPELFRATIGFDFVFAPDERGKEKCYCIEINGQESGTLGIQDIPKEQVSHLEKLIAAIRNRVNPERERLHNAIDRLGAVIEDPEFPMTEGVKGALRGVWNQKLRHYPTFLHAYQNPPLVEKLAEDKGMHVLVIPPEHFPHVYARGESAHSRFGSWVLKPRDGRGGDNIQIISDAMFQEFLGLEERLVQETRERFFREWVAQEYVPSLGADNAPSGSRGGTKPASMRLLVDFRYLEDGSVHILNEQAYQRVGPYPLGAEENLGRPGSGRPLSKEDVFIVNKARGASSATVSAEEFKAAHAIALETIRNIAAYYKEKTADRA